MKMKFTAAVQPEQGKENRERKKVQLTTDCVCVLVTCHGEVKSVEKGAFG